MTSKNSSSNPLIDHPTVKDYYQHQPNYLIETTESPTNICVIYFSSHGIYYPNEVATFQTAIIRGDRYDWKKNKLVNAKKHIFVRDIFKQWYIQGINGQLDTVEKLADWLRQETIGMDVITIGSSAGAYAAVLFGCLLKARYVYAFSPQFSLNVHDTMNDPLIQRYRHQSRAKYYDLQHLIQQSGIPVFYFYGVNSDQDQTQAALVADISNVYSFKFSSGAHGIPIFPFDFNKLLNLTQSQLIALQQHFNQHTILPLWFSTKLNGYFSFLRLYSRFAKKTLSKRIKSYF